MKKQDSNSDIHTKSSDKLTKDKNTVLAYWTSKVPYFQLDRKVSIAMTRSLNAESIIDSKDNFDLNYMTTNILNTQQLENIKSFLLSEYFIEHSKKWKSLDGYGFNCALKYLPPFDKNKQWDSKKVQEFLESFIQ